ncbi:UDP-N-acetylglucosamine 2-epimerase [Neptunomonas qingdaonensis]|uniref:UDP-N-acetylglucosamine 2-epimerase n=1 Tax=Neptunomonas qingdaonensis TaxID=1045558 RepID=A0A1I2MZW8_9GAMM|nr:UDP-N-acetylglucosamine 2-epimerase [Neptunomonas qingdaonensis]SFF96159.1 UDP-N-acetylglucosamine 2-epimerase [Neptunomonas qingdaonensis]
MSKIVLAAYGGGHINMLLPIIKKLDKCGHQLKILGLTTAGSVLKNNAIDYVGFNDLLFLSDEPDSVLEKGRELVGLSSASSLISYEESVAYMGLSYSDLEVFYGVEQAKVVYVNKGRQAFYPIFLMEKFLRNEQPDLVIATNSPRAERAIIDAARKVGIPSLCIVDLFALQEVHWIGQQGYADKVCVLSDYVKQTFVSAGRSSDEIVVTGNPVFDKLADLRTEVSNRQLQETPSCRHTILWASQPEPEKHPFTGKCGDSELPRNIDAALIKIMKKHPEWELVIRFHPSEEVHLDVLPANVRISPKNEDLYSLLQNVDLVVTMTSTVGLEAALLGLPVVTIDRSVFTDDAPYSAMGISTGVSDLDRLEATINEVVGFKQVAEIASLPQVGQATNKIINVIHDLLDEKHVSKSNQIMRDL